MLSWNYLFKLCIKLFKLNVKFRKFVFFAQFTF